MTLGNGEAVLSNIEPSLHEKVPIQDLLSQVQSPYPKALGVEWDSAQDLVSTSLNLPEHFETTKRGIISYIARLFDILGTLAPTVIRMKITYQEVWETGSDWDELFLSHFVERHSAWRQELPTLAKKNYPDAISRKGSLRSLLNYMGFVMHPHEPMPQLSMCKPPILTNHPLVHL